MMHTNFDQVVTASVTATSGQEACMQWVTNMMTHSYWVCWLEFDKSLAHTKCGMPCCVGCHFFHLPLH